MKRCTKCGEEKALGEFTRERKRGVWIRRSQCKECRNEQARLRAHGKPKVTKAIKHCYVIREENRTLKKDKMKRCTTCEEIKPFSGFHKNNPEWNNGCRVGPMSSCKSCLTKKTQEWVRKNRFKAALSDSRIKAKRFSYRFCEATVEELKAAFTGKCHVCQVPEMECNQRLHMDHDHETGKFRGFLCAACNKAAGHLKDSPKIMRKLAEYIDKEGLCVDCNQEDGFEFFN